MPKSKSFVELAVYAAVDFSLTAKIECVGAEIGPIGGLGDLWQNGPGRSLYKDVCHLVVHLLQNPRNLF